MHISLDSALGQQRRLNQVGETINSIAVPSAAYSLRSLTGGDPKVVRVRRDSDNTERDFTASDVSSGAMVDFVNTQTVKPLDVQALNSGGSGDRDGNFQIASAAYSLRSLGDRQATVAATGDTVTAANGKYVVQVRRSSDDTIKSFTADQVGTSGSSELEDFCDEATPARNRTGGAKYSSFSTDGVAGFSAVCSAAAACGYDIFGASSTAVQVSFDIVLNSGSVSVKLRPEFETGSDVSNSVTINSSGSKSFTLTSTAEFKALLFISGATDFVVSNFLVNVPYNHSAFVRTWYDQSVTDQGGGTATGNHATQTTAANQPKIVSSGALIADSAGLPELDFDGTDDHLDITFSGNLEQPNGIFMVHQSDSNSNEANNFFDSTSPAANSSTSIDAVNNDYRLANKDSGGTSANMSSANNITTNKEVVTFLLTSDGTSSSIIRNGDTSASTPSTLRDAAINANSTIGQQGASGFYSGKMQEFIIYNSEQSDNRGAYEGNIADHYSITGVPTGANTVDGFVETWYDQSGNGHNVIQATASQQPKIVSSGSLITAGVTFDEANSTELVATDPVITAAAAGTYSGFSVQTISNAQAGYVYGNASVSNGSSVFGQSSLFTVTNKNQASGFDSISKGSSEQLLSVVYNNNDAAMLVNGGGTTTDGSTYTFAAGTANFRMGNRSGGTTTGTKLTGAIREVIVYNSDQTANRTTLETNINSYYSIF